MELIALRIKMIDQSLLPKIESVLVMLGIQPGKHNRSKCPIHLGDNPTAFSFDSDEGVWYCHRCGTGGDTINLVEKALKTDFKGALQFLGMQGLGKPLKPNLKALRHREAIINIRKWCKINGRLLRDQFLHRQRIIKYAQDKLKIDPENDLAWNLLVVAFDGEALNEFLLNEIDMCRTDGECILAWRIYRDAI